MTELNSTKSRTLGAVALGIIATLAMGCGSGDGSGPTAGEQSGASQAAITARGFTVNGCVARGVFDIVAPTAIDFVAIAPTDLRHVQMLLFTVDGQGLDTPVQQTAQPPSAQLVSALDDGATDQVKVLTVATLGANVGAHTATATVGAYQNGNSANDQSANTSGFRTNEGDQSNETISHQYSYNGNGVGAGYSGAQNNAAQSTQSAASQSTATTLAFTGLSLLNSTHMMLVINMTASRANGALRLFQGDNGVVTAAQNFPIVTPACGAGA
jgi:hypothetical protein